MAGSGLDLLTGYRALRDWVPFADATLLTRGSLGLRASDARVGEILDEGKSVPGGAAFGDRAIHVLNLAGKHSDVRLDPKGDHSDATPIFELFVIVWKTHGPDSATTAIRRLHADLLRRGVIRDDAETAAFFPALERPLSESSLQRTAAIYFANQKAGHATASGARDILVRLGTNDTDVRLDKGSTDRIVFDELVAIVRDNLGASVAMETMMGLGRQLARRRSPNAVPVLKDCLPPGYDGALTPALIALINGRNVAVAS
jgi:hypothetical protein